MSRVFLQSRLTELGRFVGVGLLGSFLHAMFLFGSEHLGLSLAVSNLIGFLIASLWGYLAHAQFTFRDQTGGTPFQRRWLLIQLSLNVLVSLGLPLALGVFARQPIGTLLMVFTPSAINYMVWSLAARFSSTSGLARMPLTQPLQIHADDFGLHSAVNHAICTLYDNGVLDSASVLVTAPALDSAWQLSQQRPGLELVLHLSLSEGLPAADPALIPDLLDQRGYLAVGFAHLLLMGLMPSAWSKRRNLERQLFLEIGAQVNVFQRIFPGRPLRLDGHQHVHSLPLVWKLLKRLPPAMSPVWVRSLNEAWPWRGIPLQVWWRTWQGLGPLKWLLLQVLTLGRVAEMTRLGIDTNNGFSGVLFSGCMDVKVLTVAQRQMEKSGGLLLFHPCFVRLSSGDLNGYPHSSRFYASHWRRREAEVLIRRTR